jgi:hypothetical protein
MQNAAGEIQTPLHSAAKLLHRLPGPILQSGQLQNLLDALSQFRVAHSLRPAPISKVLVCGKVLVESDLLWNHTQRRPRGRAFASHVVSHYLDMPRARNEQAGDAADSSGFSRAVRS